MLNLVSKSKWHLRERPAKHMATQPVIAFSLKFVLHCHFSTTQPQGFIGNTPQVFAGCLRFCPAENSFGGDTVYACDVGCVGYPVERTGRVPPFGTRRNTLRRWRSLAFSYVRARAGGARNACAPVRHSQKQPCCALSFFLLPTHSALYAPRCGLSGGARYACAPFGTRKSSCAAHCLFFFCPPILRFMRRGVGKRKTAPSGAAFARWCRWSDSNRHGFYSTGF